MTLFFVWVWQLLQKRSALTWKSSASINPLCLCETGDFETRYRQKRGREKSFCLFHRLPLFKSSQLFGELYSVGFVLELSFITVYWFFAHLGSERVQTHIDIKTFFGLWQRLASSGGQTWKLSFNKKIDMIVMYLFPVPFLVLNLKCCCSEKLCTHYAAIKRLQMMVNPPDYIYAAFSIRNHGRNEIAVLPCARVVFCFVNSIVCLNKGLLGETMQAMQD